jgi:hypothetical protein
MGEACAVHLGHCYERSHCIGRHVRGRARNSPLRAVFLAVHRLRVQCDQSSGPWQGRHMLSHLVSCPTSLPRIADCILHAHRIMPAAMVPRPWDFPDPPKSLQLHTQVTPAPVKSPATAPPNQTASPTPQSSPSEAPQGSSASPPLATQDRAPGNIPLVPGST